MTLNERIKQLEDIIKVLTSKIKDLSRNLEDKNIKPYSEVSPPAKLDNMEGSWVNGIWVARGIANEIDVKNTYIVQKNTDGTIKKDSNGNEMKSPLLYLLSELSGIAKNNENLLKSNVIWDEDAKCWRFYGVFKPLPEEE